MAIPPMAPINSSISAEAAETEAVVDSPSDVLASAAESGSGGVEEVGSGDLESALRGEGEGVDLNCRTDRAGGVATSRSAGKTLILGVGGI